MGPSRREEDEGRPGSCWSFGRLWRRRSGDQGGGSCWAFQFLGERVGGGQGGLETKFGERKIGRLWWVWMAAPTRCCESMEDSRELSRSSPIEIWRICEAWASNLRFSDTLEYHSVIFMSGWSGRISLGSRVGKSSPSAGLVISNLLTASCRKGTCFSGPSNS